VAVVRAAAALFRRKRYEVGQVAETATHVPADADRCLLIQDGR
jgi:hypothetical protein